MFDKDFKISGKHANYWKDLCELAGNVPDREQHSNFKIFNAYIDAYILCPLIGYQYSRKGVIDNSVPGDAGMLSEVIIKRQNELKFIYQIIMLADEESEPDPDKRIYRATTFSEEKPEDREMIKNNMKIFNSYFLGGLEVMHEQFVDQCITDDRLFESIERKDYLSIVKESISELSFIESFKANTMEMLFEAEEMEQLAIKTEEENDAFIEKQSTDNNVNNEERPFGTAHIFEGKLYIQTGKVKDVSKQIHANPKVEICAFKNGEWLRIAGELVEDDRREATGMGKTRIYLRLLSISQMKISSKRCLRIHR